MLPQQGLQLGQEHKGAAVAPVKNAVKVQEKALSAAQAFHQVLLLLDLR